VLVPQSRVYFVPDPHVDVFFYDGYWWSPRGSQWYRARAYNGPWAVVKPARVPRAVIYVPRDYRAQYERERHIPYGQWKKDHDHWDREHWKAHKKWEKERAREIREQERNAAHGHRGDDRSGNGHSGHR